MRYPSDRKQKFLRTSLSLIGFVSALVFCCQRTVRESSGSLFPDNEISPTLRKGAFLFLPLIFPCMTKRHTNMTPCRLKNHRECYIL